MEEKDIIKELQNGNSDAYRRIIDEYQPFLLNCCFRFVHSREIARDITQDVFVEVYKSIGKFRADSSLKTWLYRIAITKSLDYLKAAKRKKRFGYVKSIFGFDEDDMNIPTLGSAPFEQVENEERIKILSDAIDSLPENQKAAFTLNKYSGLSYKEIADILGTSVSSVESLIFRGKANLKKKLFNYYKRHL